LSIILENTNTIGETMDISKYLKKLRETTESTNFEESTVGNIREFVNTGSYALNRIICGDFFGGIPNNRVIIIGGVSKSGKSLIAAITLSNAITQNNFDQIFLFDAEGGFSKDLLKKLGTDLKKIEYITVDNVEDAAIKIMSTYKMIAEIKTEQPKFKALLLLDSLGALVTRKTLKDLEEEDPKLDRGLRARMINDMIKSLTMPALKTECGIILLNHVYQNTNSNPMYPEKIHPQSGGLGIQYMSRLTFQCTSSNIKPDEKESGIAYTGTKLKVLCIKNNIVVPFLETEIEIDFRGGFVSKYSGLLELAIKYEFIKDEGMKRYIVPSYSADKMKESKLMNGPDADKIWDTFIKELNEKQKHDLQYSSFADIDHTEKEEVVLNEEKSF
jgi:RecA/RadA recombinase